jgi:hypothetical protein
VEDPLQSVKVGQVLSLRHRLVRTQYLRAALPRGVTHNSGVTIGIVVIRATLLAKKNDGNGCQLFNIVDVVNHQSNKAKGKATDLFPLCLFKSVGTECRQLCMEKLKVNEQKNILIHATLTGKSMRDFRIKCCDLKKW